MVFRFVHTADWQIGKAFGQFDTDTSAVLKEQRLQAIDAVARVASQFKAAHVLVAGDIFETPKPSERMQRQAVAKLERHDAIAWHLLPGNHDHATPGGLWERLRRDGQPGNVFIHDKPVAAELEPGVWLLPAPLTSRAQSSDPTDWMDQAVTPAGAIRIGLAHGSVRAFGSDGEASVLIRPDRIRTADLAYLALGDWHGTEKIAERVWYAGTPEPDRFPDNNPGHVLAVEVSSNSAPPKVEALRTARFHWQRASAELYCAADFSDIEAGLLAAGAASGSAPEDMLVQLSLSGRLTLSEDAALGAELARFGALLRVCEVDQSALIVSASDSDVENLDSPELEAAARRLRDDLARQQGAERAACEQALRMLYQFAQQVRGEAGT